MSQQADMPGPVKQAIGWLESQGFALAQESHGGMGGVLLTFHGGIAHANATIPVDVRVEGDRGRWSMGLRVGQSPSWFIPEVWDAFTAVKESRAQDIEFQSSFVQSRLSEMVCGFVGNPAVDLDRGTLHAKDARHGIVGRSRSGRRGDETGRSSI